MISFVFSGLGLIGILCYAVMEQSLTTFLNTHSIVLVAFGTIFIFGLSNPWDEVKGVIRAVLSIFLPRPPFKQVNRQLSELLKNRSSAGRDTHPLISYAQSLWAKGLDADRFTFMVTQRLEELNHSTERAVATMRNLAKYPPALGMTGTVIGLISLFSRLSPDSQANIGPSLALAMTATFYGLLLANAVLMPLADRLYVMYLSDRKLNDHVYQTLMLIHQGEASSLVEERLHADAA